MEVTGGCSFFCGIAWELPGQHDVMSLSFQGKNTKIGQSESGREIE